MRQCHRCGIMIPADREALEIDQFATSGARPTLYCHLTLAQCQAAQQDAGVPVTQRVRR